MGPTEDEYDKSDRQHEDARDERDGDKDSSDGESNTVDNLLAVFTAIYGRDESDPSVDDPENSPRGKVGATKVQRNFFGKVFSKRVKVRKLLALASAVRGDSHKCVFGEWDLGRYNVIVTIVFDDCVEWIAKMPKYTTDDEENGYLKSEYATLLFLQELESIPAPKVHGFCFHRKNQARTPYIFMDKISGTLLADAICKGNMNRDAVHKTLTQLAQIKKTLFQRPFNEVGSLMVSVNDKGKLSSICVDRQYTIWTLGEKSRLKYPCNYGPYQSNLQNYSMLLHNSWTNWMAECYSAEEPEGLAQRLKLHAYLTLILSSFVKPTDRFYLAHTDLHAGNLFVDDAGNITGIIDWEFTTTAPLQSGDHYPLFLSNEEGWIHETKEIYEDPAAELRYWQEFYAKQWAGDSAMQEYFANLKPIIAFENLLRDTEEANIENVVVNLKLVNDWSSIDNLQLPFPWSTPTVISSSYHASPSHTSPSHTVVSSATEIEILVAPAGDNGPGDGEVKPEISAKCDVVSKTGIAQRVKRVFARVWAACLCRQTEEGKLNERGKSV